MSSHDFRIRAGLSLVLGLMGSSAATGDDPLFPGAQCNTGGSARGVEVGDLDDDQVPDLDTGVD